MKNMFGSHVSGTQVEPFDFPRAGAFWEGYEGSNSSPQSRTNHSLILMWEQAWEMRAGGAGVTASLS
jgi:hypothetical protein